MTYITPKLLKQEIASNNDPIIKAEAFVKLAELTHQSEHYSSALQWYNTAIATEQNKTLAHISRGLLLFQQGDTNGASEDFLWVKSQTGSFQYQAMNSTCSHYSNYDMVAVRSFLDTMEANYIIPNKMTGECSSE